MCAPMSRRILAVAVVMVSMLPLRVGAADAETRPFRMSTQGHANPAFPPDGCFLTNSESATGIALHLGAMSWVSNEVVDLCAGTVEAQFVLTAADGDHLFGQLNTVALFDFVTNQVTFAGTWNITGGTGRFEDASGEGQLSGQGSLASPFDVTAEFSGVIVY